MPETITVNLDGNKTVDLQVEEFHPYEPSAYVVDPGWTCYDLNTDTEYYVNMSGDVFKQPENLCCGHAPELRMAAEKIEHEMEFGWSRDDAELSRHLRECADQDESDYRRTIFGLNENG